MGRDGLAPTLIGVKLSGQNLLISAVNREHGLQLFLSGKGDNLAITEV